MSNGWVELGGIAQFVAAGATVSLAGVTAWMAKRTHDVAEETKKESAATQSLAIEARTDRELTWRPQLDLTECWVDIPQPRSGIFHIKVFNAGGGPAIGCKVLVHLPSDVNLWCIRTFGDIASRSATNEEIEFALLREGNHPYSAFIEPEGMPVPKSDPDAVIFCSDVTGRRYRFPILNIFNDNQSTKFREEWRPFPLEVVGPKDEKRPEWADYPLLWSW